MFAAKTTLTEMQAERSTHHEMLSQRAQSGELDLLFAIRGGEVFGYRERGRRTIWYIGGPFFGPIEGPSLSRKQQQELVKNEGIAVLHYG